jgi:phosphopantetheinyl transferase
MSQLNAPMTTPFFAISLKQLEEIGPRRATLRRAQSAAGTVLIGGLIARHLPGREARIAKNETGKPFLSAATAGALPGVSLSHSGRWVAATLADGMVGLDIEIICGRDRRDLAHAYLSPQEAEWTAERGEPGFLALWTLREALAKGVGRGLAAELASQPAASILKAANTGAAQCRWEGRDWLLAACPAADFVLAAAWSPTVTAPARAKEHQMRRLAAALTHIAEKPATY